MLLKTLSDTPERAQQELTFQLALGPPLVVLKGNGSPEVKNTYARSLELCRQVGETPQLLPTLFGLRAVYLSQGDYQTAHSLAEQGQEEEGIRQMRQGLGAWRALGSGVAASFFLALPIEAYGRKGQVEEGFNALTQAFDVVHKTGEGLWEAELWRLKGELTLQSQVESPKSKVEEAESYFLKAIEITQRQQAKSLELRAATSLARLWQSQGKHHEARDMLSRVYNWFTEGFDTKDLQEAKTLIEKLR
jgi:predicted ATPase